MRCAHAVILRSRCIAEWISREIRDAEREIASGRPHLIFVAPERMLTPRFIELAQRIGVGTFAIDEAHCISQWGHDFRPEYRQLAELKTRFANASLHAYTATATERVRHDIVKQLETQGSGGAGRLFRSAESSLPRNSEKFQSRRRSRRLCAATRAKR